LLGQASALLLLIGRVGFEQTLWDVICAVDKIDISNSVTYG